MNELWVPITLGILLALTITTTMDASGHSAFSALPLLPLFLLFWRLQKFRRTEIGFQWGNTAAYVWAVAYPLVIMSALAVMAAAGDAIDTSNTDWNKAMVNLLAGGLGTILVGLVTEEGFFRGWLWAAFKKAGLSKNHTLLATTLAFTVWHISAVSLETGFGLSANQNPLYLVNVMLIGLNWGILRQWSGSIVVTSVSHGVWNGLAYSLFGFGEKTGALGIEQTWLFGPEVGLLGIALNLFFVIGFWRFTRRKSDIQAPPL